MPKIDCFTKYGAKDLQDRFEELVEQGMPEKQAARQVVTERHKELHQELNDLKKQINKGQPKSKQLPIEPYKAYDPAPKIEAINKKYEAKEEIKPKPKPEPKAEPKITEPKPGDTVMVPSKHTKGAITYFRKEDGWYFTDSRGKEQKESPSQQDNITKEWQIAQGVLPEIERKNIAQKGKDVADWVRTLRPPSGTAQSNILGLPIAVYDTAIVTIANAIEAGASMAQVISDAIQEIKKQFPNWNQEKEFTDAVNQAAAFDKWMGDVMQNFPDATPEEIMEAIKEDYPNLDAEYLSELEQRVRKIVEAPKKEEPRGKVAPKEEKESGQKFDNKAIIGRILESENVSDDVKEILRPNLKYKVRSQAEARRVAKDLINEFGIDSALVMAESGKFHGDVNSAIFAVSLDKVYEEGIAANTPQEKLKTDEKWADIALRYQEAAESGGRFVSFIADFYKKNPAGLVIKTEKEFQKRQDEYFKGREKSTKEAFEELINTVEGKEIIAALVEEQVAKRTEQKKRRVYSKENENKVRSFFRNLKINTNNTGSYLIPPQLYNAAITIIEEAVIGGMSIARAIDQAVEYINERNQGKSWKVNEFKKDIKDGFEKLNAKRILTDEEKERILKKWRKKLGGLSEAEQNSLLNRAFTQLMEAGALDYDDFKRMYAQAVGLPTMTPEMAEKLKKLAEAINKPDELKTKLQQNPTEQGKLEYLKSLRDAEVAAKDLNELIGKEKWWVDTFVTIARLNTLGVVSLIGNVVYNISSMPVRFGVNLTATGLDYLLAGVQTVSDKMFGTKLYDGRQPYNVLKVQGGYVKGFKYGTQKAIEQTISGLTNRDYFQKEIRQNIQPLSGLQKFWRIMTRQERATLNSAVNSFMEGTMGWSAEAVARFLNLGDKPFRFASEYAKAEQLAQEKGLRGIDKEVFIIAPDDESAEIIRQHGEEMTLQQKNIVTQYLDAGGNALKRFIEDKGQDSKLLLGGIKILGYGTQPFLNTPLNAFVEFMNYAFPPIALAKAARAGIKGDTQLSTKHTAQAIIGMSIGYTAFQLVKAGLLRPDLEDDDTLKEMEGVMNYGRPGQLNWSGMLRYVAGENPEAQDGDSWVDVKYWGFVGMMLLAKANQYKETPQLDVKEQVAFQDMLSAFPSAIKIGLTEGVFSSTGNLFKALTLGGSYTDRWLLGMASVYQNAFQPQFIASLSRADNDYMRDTKGMTLSETAVNKIKERVWLADDLPKKINIWGEEIPSVPSGNDKYVWHFFSLNKKTVLDNEKFGYKLYSLYEKTKRADIFPPSIKREIRGVKLTPQEYEQYKILVGKQRKSMVDAYIKSNPKELVKDDIDKITDKLSSKYEMAKDIATKEFLAAYPNIQAKILAKSKK